MSHHESPIRQQWVQNTDYYTQITEDVCRPIESKPNLKWLAAFGLSFLVLCLLIGTVTWTIWEGIGAWGLNKTVGWAFDITNFVFWVGIGHAGTLISAVLLLFRQAWRNSINRATEAMTIFCGDVCRIVPYYSHGASLVRSMDVSYAEYPWFSLGQLQLASSLGCICDFNLFQCLISLLVSRDDA